MTIADYAENKILDKVLKNVDFTVTAVYVKLHTGDPGENGTSNAAAETTRKAATFASASSGSSASNADVDWTSYPSAETVSHVSLWDAVTAGNCLWTGALSSAKTMSVGDTFRLPSGQVTVSLD